MAVAVGDVDHRAKHKPDRKPRPRLARQAPHHEQARGHAERRHDPHERHGERPRPIRLPHPQHEHARADEREREQGPDVGEVVGLRRIADERRHRHDHSGHDRRHVRDAGRRIDPGGPAGQQPVARHRKEDARLSVLKHQQHGRHRDDGAERHDPADAGIAGQFERTRQRIRHRELLGRHHTGEHDADEDVNHRADGKTAENPDRQVALGISGFLRGRGNRVEADVRKEHAAPWWTPVNPLGANGV